ncbi:hypothetical protein O6H91_03G120000 [Diphasiastrum complanatum]|uniref:Uncharacterized protein n=1 Tax=Diphasiastrum complanatum TaxID=34168 RepID=A0ACC2EAN6_DIPCM|nr:hypothetical protein O6H91_03G120000 [Diphasiastrum complanatum]
MSTYRVSLSRYLYCIILRASLAVALPRHSISLSLRALSLSLSLSLASSLPSSLSLSRAIALPRRSLSLSLASSLPSSLSLSRAIALPRRSLSLSLASSLPSSLSLYLTLPPPPPPPGSRVQHLVSECIECSISNTLFFLHLERARERCIMLYILILKRVPMMKLKTLYHLAWLTSRLYFVPLG